ncbi:MAG: hypothetical protein WA637_25700, partial [Terriglobales bacterium]
SDVLDIDLNAREEAQVPINDATHDFSQTLCDSNPHGARFPGFGLARYFNGASRVPQYGMSFVEKTVACVGKKYSGRIAFEQANADLPFKVTDLTAERRLGNLHAAGRFREIQFLGDRDKVP